MTSTLEHVFVSRDNIALGLHNTARRGECVDEHKVPGKARVAVRDWRIHDGRPVINRAELTPSCGVGSSW